MPSKRANVTKPGVAAIWAFEAVYWKCQAAGLRLLNGLASPKLPYLDYAGWKRERENLFRAIDKAIVSKHISVLKV